jgi:hypothetical protein
MKAEALQSKDFSKIVELMWPWWPSTQISLNDVAPVGKHPPPSPNSAAIKDYHWKQEILPLLEACLHVGDFEKASEIYFDLASRPALASETTQAQRLAKSHKFAFPETYVIKGKASALGETKSFIGDPVVGNVARYESKINRLDDICANGYLNLIVVVPSDSDSLSQAAFSSQADSLFDDGLSSDVEVDSPPQADPLSQVNSSSRINALDSINTDLSPSSSIHLIEQHIRLLLSQNQLPEFRVHFAEVMKSSHPIAKELIDREGLQSNTFFWGVLDHDARFHNGSPLFPDVDAILNLISPLIKQSHLQILRKFSRDNPESVTAKLILLSESARIGKIKTQNHPLANDGFLDDFSDIDFWGEFVRVSNTVFPQILLCSDPVFQFVSSSLPFKSSKLLQQFATRNFGLVESALQNRPHSRFLWEWWGLLSPFASDRSLPSFLETLTPVPSLPGFPPAFLYPGLIDNYLSTGAYTSIIELLEPIWNPLQLRIDEGEAVEHRLSLTFWENYISHLCYAYEKIGHEQKAQNLLSTWKQAGGVLGD